MHCERLRAWKNAHRRFFFFQDVITEAAQRAWFEGYRQRPDDYMFIVQAGDEPIGCMGIRRRDGQADVYNVILGRPDYGGRGLMTRAMRLLCSDARRRFGCEVVARVLKDNPALGWYERQGFEVVSSFDEYVFIRLAEARFVPVPVASREILV